MSKKLMYLCFVLACLCLMPACSDDNDPLPAPLPEPGIPFQGPDRYTQAANHQNGDVVADSLYFYYFDYNKVTDQDDPLPLVRKNKQTGETEILHQSNDMDYLYLHEGFLYYYEGSDEVYNIWRMPTSEPDKLERLFSIKNRALYKVRYLDSGIYLYFPGSGKITQCRLSYDGQNLEPLFWDWNGIPLLEHEGYIYYLKADWETGNEVLYRSKVNETTMGEPVFQQEGFIRDCIFFNHRIHLFVMSYDMEGSLVSIEPDGSDPQTVLTFPSESNANLYPEFNVWGDTLFLTGSFYGESGDALVTGLYTLHAGESRPTLLLEGDIDSLLIPEYNCIIYQDGEASDYGYRVTDFQGNTPHKL